MTLLSANDLSAIQTALDTGLSIAMDRTLGPLHIRVTTRRAGRAWWPAVMLARVERWEGNVYSTQYVTSAEEIRGRS